MQMAAMNYQATNSPPFFSSEDINQIITELDVRFYDQEILPHLTPERGEMNAELFRKAFKKNPQLPSQLGKWLGALWQEPTDIEAKFGDVLLHPKVGYFLSYPDNPATIAFLEGFIQGALASVEEIRGDGIAQIKMEKMAKLFNLLLHKEIVPELILSDADFLIALVKLEHIIKTQGLNKRESSLLAQVEALLNQNKITSEVQEQVPDDLEGAFFIIGGKAKKKQSTATLYQQKYAYLRTNVLKNRREEVFLSLLGLKATHDEAGKTKPIPQYNLLEILSPEELRIWSKLFDWVLPSLHDRELQELNKSINKLDVVPVTILFILRRVDPDRGQKIAEILLNDLQRPKLSDAISQGLRGPIIESLRRLIGIEREVSERSSAFSWFQLVDNYELQKQVIRYLNQVSLVASLEDSTKNLIDFLLDIRGQLVAATNKLKS